MKTSKSEDGIAELSKALIELQSELKPVVKDQTALVESKRTGAKYSYNYVDLVAVTELAKPILHKHKLAVTQLISQSAGQDTLETVLLHESGQWISSEMRLILPQSDPQGQGSAITYARRYAFMAVLGMTASEEDDDAQKASQAATQQDFDKLKAFAWREGGITNASQYEEAIKASTGKTLAALKTKEELEAVKQYIEFEVMKGKD